MTKIKIQATIREQVYEILKERILSGYYPGGTHLSEQQICSELDISRSPVREAIRLLEADGLLSGEANKGVEVRTFTEKDVRNMYQVENLVQVGSIRFGFKDLDRKEKDWFRDIRQAFIDAYETNDSGKYLEVSTRFHNKIAELSGNELIVGFYRRNGTLCQNFRGISLQNRRRLESSHNEHLRMIEAILSDDQEDLMAIMSYHISESLRATLLAIPKASDIE